MHRDEHIRRKTGSPGEPPLLHCEPFNPCFFGQRGIAMSLR
jgi:hypothetical protein